MSAATLNRFTVPLASDQSATTQGLLMPKLVYRFRVTLENFGVSASTTELTKQVMDFKRPQVKFDPIVLDVYNSKIQLAGKTSWESVTMKVRDDATGQVQKLVGEQLQKQFDYFEQSSAVSGQDYKFKAVCEILDGGNGGYTPVALETWELYGCYISSADYGQLDYKTSEAATISLTLLFDNALQTPVESKVGVGAHVGRTSSSLATAVGASTV
jgi:hypothetical protein